MAEIGGTYVAISTSCDFWAYRSIGPRGTPDGVLYEGRLTAGQVAEVDELLRLETWTALGPEHGICCIFDFSPSSYHWGTRTLKWFGTPDPVGPPPLPEGFPLDPSTVHVDVHELLSEYGAPVAEGPVRYVLIEVSDPRVGRPYDSAPTWPLDTAISTVAVLDLLVDELQSRGLEPPAHRAEAEDAAELRAIRAAAIAGDFGDLVGIGFTPIQEPDGSQYQLYLRDVGSFEVPEGKPARDPLAL